MSNDLPMNVNNCKDLTIPPPPVPNQEVLEALGLKAPADRVLRIVDHLIAEDTILNVGDDFVAVSVTGLEVGVNHFNSDSLAVVHPVVSNQPRAELEYSFQAIM